MTKKNKEFVDFPCPVCCKKFALDLEKYNSYKIIKCPHCGYNIKRKTSIK